MIWALKGCKLPLSYICLHRWCCLQTVNHLAALSSSHNKLHTYLLLICVLSHLSLRTNEYISSLLLGINNGVSFHRFHKAFHRSVIYILKWTQNDVMQVIWVFGHYISVEKFRSPLIATEHCFSYYETQKYLHFYSVANSNILGIDRGEKCALNFCMYSVKYYNV